MIGRTRRPGRCGRQRNWLLAPAAPELIDTLAEAGAGDEDAEPDDAPEDDDPGEYGYR